MIFSSSAVTAQWTYGDPMFFLKRQLFFLGAGFVLLYVGLRIDYRWYRRAAYPILFGTMALLAVVVVAGHTAGGATRWIRIGPLTFQPGEWTKIAIIMVLAYSMAKKGDRVKSFAVGIVPHLALVGAIVGLLMMQPDFGTSVIVLTSLDAGSGSTIIAAEQTGRRCYAMDIEPRFVQVAKERWEAFTGSEATRG